MWTGRWREQGTSPEEDISCAMGRGSSLRLHYEEEDIAVELTGGENRRQSGCFGPATTNGGGVAPVLVEGALRLARRGVRGGNGCMGESSWG
jgi:hypothetical protein